MDEVRQQTKAEKKRLAMAMREKQLGALGMAVGHLKTFLGDLSGMLLVLDG